MTYTPEQLKTALCNGQLSEQLSRVYGSDSTALQAAAERYAGAIEDFVATFPQHQNSPLMLFSAPGRTEIGGNHTDHQHGRVLAAGVNLDVIAVVAKNQEGILRVKSRGFNKTDIVNLSDLSPKAAEQNRSASICRGIAARFQALGFRIGGFDAYTTSNVLKGSGLSSSAAFEVLLGTIFSQGFNEGKADAVLVAQIGQYAENHYFGKPCGLMDQTASSVGSFVSIDFENPEKPVVEKITFDFADYGYAMCIVDSQADHSDLTDDYASIPAEMKQVAAYFGKQVLRQVAEEEFYSQIKGLRGSGMSDRAILRAIHFLAENKRVAQQVKALKEGDFQTFLKLIQASGESSFLYNQNVFSPRYPAQQAVSLALALSEKLLKEKGGAWRVHGGGFAGTIQAFVPIDWLTYYKNEMEAVFGTDSCHIISVRPVGGTCLLMDR